MPPPKKAAKKAAKHATKHANPRHKETKDLRRAFEHLGRVQSLQSSVETEAQTDVSTLVTLAQKELARGEAKNAADLLRAAEHFSFASLAASHFKQSKLSSVLAGAIEEEYEHLTHKAREHWDSHENRHPSVASLHKRSLQEAKRAYVASNYRRALELARAAEALAHVTQSGPEELTTGRTPLSLTGAGL